MRKQTLETTSRGATSRRLALALPAAVAMLVAYMVPATVSAEVEVKQEFMTAQQARMTHGEDLYNELCAVCHGQYGKGDGPAAPALKQIPIDLTVLKVNNDNVFPQEQLEKLIYGKNRIAAHGTLDMPIWGRAFEYTKPDWGRVKRIKFAKHRIHNIVEYIESLQTEVAG